MAEARSWLIPAVFGVFAITALRVLALAFNKTDLFVDEAQYWLWGQDLAFGYYSKPPLIGWVIRAFTELGTDAPFWVRVPAPLFHAATALTLGAIAAQLSGTRAAVVTALAYVTLPLVAVGSLLISTDTIMFPFLAAALAGYLRLLGRPSTGLAVLTGTALGLAFLAKYAAIYYVITAIAAAFMLPGSRPGGRSVALMLVAFLVVISPNLLWNLANGFTTLQHTLDNADWVRDPAARAGLNFAGLAEFFAAQFAVFGPVFFAALLVLAMKWRHLDTGLRRLLIFSLPIVAIVCVQALLSRAYANWAASAYLAGTLAVIPWLLRNHRAWLIAGFAINGALSLILPLATTVPELLQRNGQPLLNRYIGRTEMTQDILQTAETAGLSTIVAADRDILADLFYTARNSDIRIFALSPQGRAPHHYALRYPYRATDEMIMIIARANEPAPCADAVKLNQIRPATGAYRNRPQSLYRASGDCLRR